MRQWRYSVEFCIASFGTYLYRNHPQSSFAIDKSQCIMVLFFSTNAHAHTHHHPQAEEERDLTAAAKESSEGLSLLLFVIFFIVGIVLCAQLNCMIENRREAYYDKQQRKQ
jgi:hypothetical protein